MSNASPIKFFSVKYHFADIREAISGNPTLNAFVFTFHDPGTGEPLQLVSNLRLGLDCNKMTYSPDVTILERASDEPLSVDGAFFLANNFVSLSTMEAFIGYPAINHGHLTFTPALDATGHLFYNIEGAVGVTMGGDPPVTNPSPPATII